MIRIEKEKTGDLVKAYVSGKLTQEDYDKLIPILEKTLEEWPKLRFYFEMHDFEGWTMGAAFADLGFDVKHATDMAKVAMVGEEKWQETLSKIMKPFTTADVRFFPLSEKEEALRWIKS